MNRERSLYSREKYLSVLRPFYSDRELIKVVTGVRRCGKSSLLELVRKEIKSHGVAEANILSINLDQRPYIGVH